MPSKRSGAGSVAYTVVIGLLALTFTCPRSSVHAQSADVVLCDRLAADPTDPDKPKDVKGAHQIEASDVATAIKFCKLASAASRRALYQLGRAYAANQQLTEAAGAYRRAAEKGSTSAMVELGVLLATGSGVAKDEAQARKLFERAAAGGNPQGATNLAALNESGGATLDPAQTRAALAKAADANSAEAQYQHCCLPRASADQRTTPPRGHYLKRRPRRIIPRHWSGWARLPKTGAADRRMQAPPKPITRKPRRSATKRRRRRSSARNVPTSSRISGGNVVTYLCF
jgi:hypothetical protein